MDHNHVFCEACGDCVYCYGEDSCYKTGGEHVLPSQRPTLRTQAEVQWQTFLTVIAED